MRVGIIGAGGVGVELVNYLLTLGNMSEIILVNRAKEKAWAEIEDFSYVASFTYAKNTHLHYGDYVYVEKSGEIIPKVIGVDQEKINIDIAQGTRGDKIIFPKTCPDCGTTLVKEGAIWKCPEREMCIPQRIGRLVQFCSKNAMNIEGIGPAVANDLILYGIVEIPIDLYGLANCFTVDEIVNLLPKGYGKKTIEKILEQVEKSKERPFEALLFALCIDSLGKNTAKLIANHFKDLDTLMDASTEDFQKLEGIGEITAKKIYWGLRQDDSLECARKFGLKVSIEEEKEFLNNYHLQGYIKSNICLGVYYNNELIATQSFSKPEQILLFIYPCK
jgi:DNA ligase (NAD+)